MIQVYIRICNAWCWSKHLGIDHVLLQSLLVPDGPWKSISLDFVTALPSSEGFDVILAIVDWFTKMAHFLPCPTTIKSQQKTYLVMHCRVATRVRVEGRDHGGHEPGGDGGRDIDPLWSGCAGRDTNQAILGACRELQSMRERERDYATTETQNHLNLCLYIYVQRLIQRGFESGLAQTGK